MHLQYLLLPVLLLLRHAGTILLTRELVLLLLL